MNRWTRVAIFFLAVFARVAAANEYPLQFTPNPGFRGLVVAGYKFAGSTVIGNCSYYTLSSGSGRGAGYHSTLTNYDQTCTWDLYGNLLSIAQGAPAVPAPIAYQGTETIYAATPDGSSFTGTDSKLPSGGFVDTPGPHYSWVAGHVFEVIGQGVLTLNAKLESDGAQPLSISAVEPSAAHGMTSLISTTCSGEIAVGATCTVTVSYDPTQICSTSRLGYDTMSIGVTSNTGQALDFVQSFVILLNHRNNKCAVSSNN